jgi:hypothetical protein
VYELHEAGSLHYRSGDQIMQEMGGNPGLDEDRAAFVRTIHVMAQDDLIAFELLIHGLVLPPRPESYEYLAHLRNFTIRTNGLDRARGIKIADPPPDPGEDDGRIISKLTLEEMASIIGACYSMQQTWDFLIEAGISVERSRRQMCLQTHRRSLAMFLLSWRKGRGAGGVNYVASSVPGWMIDSIRGHPEQSTRSSPATSNAKAGLCGMAASWKASLSEVRTGLAGVSPGTRGSPHCIRRSEKCHNGRLRLERRLLPCSRRSRRSTNGCENCHRVTKMVNP